MKYENFRFSDAGYIILRKRYTFKRPEGRKTWPSKPAETSEEEFFTAQQYENFVTSIPFFNRFGGRASCRASWSYTVAGYLPTEITTISPDATIRTFRVEYIRPDGSIVPPYAWFLAQEYLPAQKQEVIP